MMQHLRRLLRYDVWANQETLRSLMIVIVVRVSRARRLPLRSFLVLRWPARAKPHTG